MKRGMLVAMKERWVVVWVVGRRERGETIASRERNRRRLRMTGKRDVIPTLIRSTGGSEGLGVRKAVVFTGLCFCTPWCCPAISTQHPLGNITPPPTASTQYYRLILKFTSTPWGSYYLKGRVAASLDSLDSCLGSLC